MIPVEKILWSSLRGDQAEVYPQVQSPSQLWTQHLAGVGWGGGPRLSHGPALQWAYNCARTRTPSSFAVPKYYALFASCFVNQQLMIACRSALQVSAERVQGAWWSSLQGISPGGPCLSRFPVIFPQLFIHPRFENCNVVEHETGGSHYSAVHAAGDDHCARPCSQ